MVKYFKSNKHKGTKVYDSRRYKYNTSTTPEPEVKPRKTLLSRPDITQEEHDEFEADRFSQHIERQKLEDKKDYLNELIDNAHGEVIDEIIKLHKKKRERGEWE